MEDRKFYAFSNEILLVLRELLQFAILTDTNVIENLMQIRMEPSAENEHLLTLTPEYMEFYNGLADRMNAQIQELLKVRDEVDTKPVGDA